MRIGVAQTRPVPGDIEANIDRHMDLIRVAIDNKAELVVFPEMSITGYEPTLAERLAVDKTDQRFDIFQQVSDTNQMAIAIGAPTRDRDGICISLILFQPASDRYVYSKMHLHQSEERFFVPGPPANGIIDSDEKIALAICYEVSVPQHAANASENGAKIYLASVADATKDIERVHARLGTIAREYSMLVLMSNCVGSCHDWQAAGRTAIWNNQGAMLSQLDGTSQGIIVVDSKTGHTSQQTLDAN